MGAYLEVMTKRFRDLRVPARDLTLDEFTMPWRGRHRARCFNPNKPCRYHLKGFSLNEATTGYCCNFAMYEGRDEKRPKGVTATSWPVLNLVGGWDYIHHRGYILWADNWFSGLPSVKTCLDVGVGYSGTARSDRIGAWSVKGLSAEDKKVRKALEKAQKKAWVRGDYRARSMVMGGHTVWAIQWQDSKVVSFLTTVKSVMGRVQRKSVNKKTREYTEQDISIPSVYSAYNYGKVGTDRMDQMVGAYYRNTKHRWHVKLMLHVGLIALNNAHITYLDQTGQTRTNMPFLDFLLAVVDELKPSPKKARATPTKGVCGGADTHTPVYTYGQAAPLRSKEDWSTKPEKEKRWFGRRCVQCKTIKSRYKCLECDVYLHIHDGEAGRECWAAYHSSNH